MEHKLGVMLSIHPEWIEKIAEGKKTIEVRKNKPKLEPPFKCYIYCTKPKHSYDDFFTFFAGTEDYFCYWGGGRVVGEFICEKIVPIRISCSAPNTLKKGYEIPGTALTDLEIQNYLGNGITGYGWCISNLKIYRTPKDITEFWYSTRITCTDKEGNTVRTIGMRRPPQSWCYVWEAENDGGNADGALHG